MASEQNKRCFLSYSSRDGDFAEGLAQALNLHGLGVWFAPQDIHAGDFFANRIVPAIKQANVFLLLCSSHSTGHSSSAGSKHVLRELTLADEYVPRILPLLIDDSYFNSLPDAFRYFLADKQYLDLRGAVALGKPPLAADQILVQLQAVNNRPRDDTALLASAEQSLKHCDHQTARDILSRVRNKRSYLAQLFGLVTQMQSKPLASQSLDTVNKWVQTLQPLVAEDRPEIPYTLAVLSSYYFERKAFFDPTAGLQQLSLMAGAGNVPASFRKIIDHIVPAEQNFALLWRTVLRRRQA